jgi:dimeric dUTPase (all-alpha-NTP-PPase superfamily)
MPVTYEMEQFFTMQSKLDNRILEKNPSAVNERRTLFILNAFRIELGEFLNEHRHFKFWSADRAIRFEPMKEECADVFHFLLSLGILNKFAGQFRHRSLNEFAPHRKAKPSKVQLYEYSATLFENMFRYKSDYEQALKDFLNMAHHAGISVDDLAQGYLDKNKENHRRAAGDY